MSANQQTAPELARLQQMFKEGKFQAVLKLTQPSQAVAHGPKVKSVRAACLYRLNRIDQAEEELAQIPLKELMQEAEALTIKGLIHRAKGRTEQALELLKQATEQHPNHFDAWHNRSLLELDLAQSTAALASAKRANEIRPDNPESLKQIGRCHINLRNADAAEEVYRKILKLQPNSAEALNGIGGVYLMRNQPEEAVTAFEKALKISPNTASARANCGLAYKYLGQTQKAEQYLTKAMALEPNNPEHQWNLSLLRLTLGDFESGWKLYESRYSHKRIAVDRVVAPKTKVPMLNPQEEAKGKTIVILHEQGMGDTLQFIRYAAQLKEEGATAVVVIVAEALVGIIKTSPYLSHVLTKWPANLPVDRWIFTASLPMRYTQNQRTIPNRVPYLFPSEQAQKRWASKINDAAGKRKKVGIVWAGRPTHSNDSNRSLALEQLKPLLDVEGICFYSIQVGDRERDLTDDYSQVINLGKDIKTYEDTAGIFSVLDLLITIDSSPAHLAGAMGIPVWTMVPHIVDFRWQLERTDSPWYPTMRLFRQKGINEWPHAIEEVKRALTQWVTTEDKKRPDDLCALLDDTNSTGHTDAGVQRQLRLAVAQHQAGNKAAAERIYRWVLVHDAQNLDAIRNLAVICRVTKKYQEASALYEQGLRLNSQDKALLGNYANLLCDLGDFAAAETMAKRGLEIDPEQPTTRYILALSLENQGRSEEAWPHAEAASMADPENGDYRALKAIVALKTGRVSLATEILPIAFDARPNRPDLANCVGLHYQGQDAYVQALRYYAAGVRATEVEKSLLLNQGAALQRLGLTAESLVATRRALAADPELKDASFNLALFLLLVGEFEEGWALYETRTHEARQAKDRVERPTLQRPELGLEDVNGRVVLMFPEQGHGDAIQFARLAHDLKARGATVWAATRDNLYETIKSCQAISRVYRDGETTDPYHRWVMPLSLPHRLGMRPNSIPAQVPYLAATPAAVAAWAARIHDLRQSPRQRVVALCWKGSASHAHDRFRTPTLSELAPILAVQGIRWVSINLQPSQQDLDFMQVHDVVDLGSDIKTFDDTAGILSAVDLLITLDSAPAHLAGALARPVWTLLPHVPDFRWFLYRSDTPWYPTMHLFRQQAMFDWKVPVGQMQARLESWLQSGDQQALRPPQRHARATNLVGLSWEVRSTGVARELGELFLADAKDELFEVVPVGGYSEEALEHSFVLQAYPKIKKQYLELQAKLAQSWSAGRTVQAAGVHVYHAYGEGLKPVAESRAVVGAMNSAFLSFSRAVQAQAVPQALHAMHRLYTFAPTALEPLRTLGLNDVRVLPPIVDFAAHAGFGRIRCNLKTDWVIASVSDDALRCGADLVASAFVKALRTMPNAQLWVHWQDPDPSSSGSRSHQQVLAWLRQRVPADRLLVLQGSREAALQRMGQDADVAVFACRHLNEPTPAALATLASGVPTVMPRHSAYEVILEGAPPDAVHALQPAPPKLHAELIFCSEVSLDSLASAMAFGYGQEEKTWNARSIQAAEHAYRFNRTRWAHSLFAEFRNA